MCHPSPTFIPTSSNRTLSSKNMVGLSVKAAKKATVSGIKDKIELIFCAKGHVLHVRLSNIRLFVRLFCPSVHLSFRLVGLSINLSVSVCLSVCFFCFLVFFFCRTAPLSVCLCVHPWFCMWAWFLYSLWMLVVSKQCSNCEIVFLCSCMFACQSMCPSVFVSAYHFLLQLFDCDILNSNCHLQCRNPFSLRFDKPHQILEERNFFFAPKPILEGEDATFSSFFYGISEM